MPFSHFIARNFSMGNPYPDDDHSEKSSQGEPCPGANYPSLGRSPDLQIQSDNEDPQISIIERHVQEYRKSQKQCRDLQRNLEDSTKQREHLERQLNSDKSRMRDLNITLDSCRKELRVSKMNQFNAEERLRRQTQTFEKCRAALETALAQRDSLVIRQVTLQRWTERLADDEARQNMAQLYQGVERWVERYFSHRFPANKALGVNPESQSFQENNLLDVFFRVYDLVSYKVFEEFLTRTMIGIDDCDFSNKVAMLDRHIRDECPAHVAQHWRSAMNRATFSLFYKDRDSYCRQVAVSLESSYEQYSSGNPEKRVRDLQNLLERFVGLKFRLDSQADLYTFTWKGFGTTFNEEEMTSFTGECPENGIVKYCLSPALYKESKGFGLTLVKKAIVILCMDMQYSSGDDYDSNGTACAQDVKMEEI